VLARERQSADALAADDRSEKSRQRVTAAKRAAVSAMRDMLLDGIPSGKRANRTWLKEQRPDPREELRRFVESHTKK
jgi:hypothetical protein